MSEIRIKELYKSFGDTEVLKDINMEVKDGEFITLLGPSGCGKSTLLRIIAGFEEAGKGIVEIDGEDIAPVPVNRRDIGMVFQSYALFPNMTVFDNVAFGLRTKKVGAREIKERVEEILGLVSLEDRMQYYPNELSGGQQQRVALSRALVTNPRVLLLDEPLSALDAKIRESLRKMIKDVQRKLKITTVFVTHDQEEALSISDRIFVMNSGIIVQSGNPEEIYRSPKTHFVAQFIGTYNFFEAEKVDVEKKTAYVPFPIIVNDIPSDPGKDYVFGIRPEAVKIVDDAAGDNILEGTIRDISILGNVIRVTVDVSGKTVYMDRLYDEKSREYKTGANVHVMIDKDSILWLRN